MVMPYRGESIDSILGQEFLTWLWYQSDNAPETFTDSEGNPFSISMEQRIVVEGGVGETRETATVSGTGSPLREARFGLGMGKKVSRALLRLEKDDLAFQVVLKAENFCLNSLTTPKLERSDDEDQEPDALLLEKFYLLEMCVSLIDNLYARFLKLRLSHNWEKEVYGMRQWMIRTE
ncbi:MAG: hypothetical protein IJU37_05765 [Desulfovibrio sp.]|nr:hypothetical protein [Desulfovibrio sp.]